MDARVRSSVRTISTTEAVRASKSQCRRIWPVAGWSALSNATPSDATPSDAIYEPLIMATPQRLTVGLVGIAVYEYEVYPWPHSR